MCNPAIDVDRVRCGRWKESARCQVCAAIGGTDIAALCRGIECVAQDWTRLERKIVRKEGESQRSRGLNVGTSLCARPRLQPLGTPPPHLVQTNIQVPTLFTPADHPGKLVLLPVKLPGGTAQTVNGIRQSPESSLRCLPDQHRNPLCRPPIMCQRARGLPYRLGSIPDKRLASTRAANFSTCDFSWTADLTPLVSTRTEPPTVVRKHRSSQEHDGGVGQSRSLSWCAWSTW